MNLDGNNEDGEIQPFVSSITRDNYSLIGLFCYI